MKEVCELAGVNYQTFRNWKYSKKYLSDKIINELLNAMKKITEDIA